MNFVQSMRSEYLRAGGALNGSLALIALVNALTIALLYSPPSLSWILLSIGLLFQIGSLILRLVSDRHARVGQKFRHLALVQDGIGHDPNPVQLAVLLSQLGPTVGNVNNSCTRRT